MFAFSGVSFSAGFASGAGTEVVETVDCDPDKDGVLVFCGGVELDEANEPGGDFSVRDPLKNGSSFSASSASTRNINFP